MTDRTFETCGQSLLAPMVRAMTDAEDAVVLGIMCASENEKDLFGKAIYLLRERGITTLRDLLAFIARERAIQSGLMAGGPPERSRTPGAQPMNVQMKPPVSAEEIKRRREAIENARTANRLEGLAASSGVRAIHDLWATGQITDEERRTRVRALIAAEAAIEPGEVSG